MELVVFVVSLVVLCLLSARFGVDSRIDWTERDRRLLFSDRRDRAY